MTSPANGATSSWQQMMLDSYNSSNPIPVEDHGSTTSSFLSQYAQREHQTYNHVPICASLSQLGLTVSPSVRWYFTYQQILMIKNIIMGVAGLVWTIVYIQHLASLPDQSYSTVLWSGSNAPWIWLSATNMPDYLVPYWYTLVISNCMLSLAWTFVARRYISRTQRSSDANTSVFESALEDRHHLTERMGRGGQELALDAMQDNTVIHNNIKDLQIQQAVTAPGVSHRDVATGKHVSTAVPSTTAKPSVVNNVATKPITITDPAMEIPVAQSFKKLVPLEIEEGGKGLIELRKKAKTGLKMIGWTKSAALFCGLLCAQIVVNYYAYVFAPTFNSQIMLSFVISIGLLVFNEIWKKLSNYATSLEEHDYLTTFLTSSFIKTQIFKLITTVVVFNISQLRLFLPASEDVYALQFPNNCLFQTMTELFAINICTDMVSSIAASLILPMLSNATTRCRSKHSTYGDSELRPTFSLPDQYSQLLYYEALVVLATPDFPLYPALSCLWTWMRGYIDRIYLLRFCSPVVMTNNTYKDPMMVMSLVSVLIMIICPPNAALWLLVSWSDQCQSLFG